MKSAPGGGDGGISRSLGSRHRRRRALLPIVFIASALRLRSPYDVSLHFNSTVGPSSSGEDLCGRLARSTSRAATAATPPSFPPRKWAESPPSRAPQWDNFSAVSAIMNDGRLDESVPFELGRAVNRSMPALPFHANTSKFHPCCAPFLGNATAGERTFERVEFDLADFFRAMGNNSRLWMAGDSVSRGSAQSALCNLVAAGADFYQMKWNHAANEELMNRTRDNGGHAPTICKTWFRSWSSFHFFSLPPPGLVAEARIPLEGTLPSDSNVGRTFHELVWLTEPRGAIDIPKSEPQNDPKRSALLLNFGLWWNIGGSVNNGLTFEDDSPARLYEQLVAQFQKIAAASSDQSASSPFVFWRENTPQLFPSFEVARTRGPKCEHFPDLYVGGNFPDGDCAMASGGDEGKKVYGWAAGRCRRDSRESLGWNRAAPYRWRQRLAVHAALGAGLNITMPPVTALHKDGGGDAVSKSSSNESMAAGEVLWIPFHDAALQNREVYKESGDCTHPDPFRRAFWSVLWDGMARHIIQKRCSG